MSEAIERRMQELRQLAMDYGKAKANAVYIDKFLKSKLAMLMQEAEARDPQKFKTTSAQEREALAHPDYTDLLHGLEKAVEVSEQSYWFLKIAEMGAELWRTEQSNLRAERRGYGA